MVISKYSFELNDLIDRAVFQVANTACFLWKNMDDAHIIYDNRSGYSQALNEFACEILDIIGEKPSSLSDILTALQVILDRPIEDELQQQVRETLVIFDQMGLIEPMKPE